MSDPTTPPLLPCPFCGHAAFTAVQEIENTNYGGMWYRAGCTGCGVSFPNNFQLDAAIREWNDRMPATAESPDVAGPLSILKPAGHTGDEETGRCDEDCKLCAWQAVQAKLAESPDVAELRHQLALERRSMDRAAHDHKVGLKRIEDLLAERDTLAKDVAELRAQLAKVTGERDRLQVFISHCPPLNEALANIQERDAIRAQLASRPQTLSADAAAVERAANHLIDCLALRSFPLRDEDGDASHFDKTPYLATAREMIIKAESGPRGGA